MDDEIKVAYRRYLAASAQFSATHEKIEALEAKIRAVQSSIAQSFQEEDVRRSLSPRVLN
ncbi:hypothetical protein [Deinococcus ruber]|uniref:hypothetical protein n=1 Tax=Deinococcus ruber TaxID=1848197 RepID=UPI0016653D58|nr:hypothetical protein [Deinococcus ruber]